MLEKVVNIEICRPFFITMGKKSSIYFVVAGKFYYDQKKKSNYFVVARKFYYDRKKKFYLFCCGGKVLLRPEKNKIQSSVWRVRDHYYDRKKKIQSSVWRVRDHYYDRKKKDTVVYLAGARSLLRPEKKKF